MVHSREFILDNICWALGGRASEEVFFGRLTTGASGDLQQSTRQARAMVMRFGMSDKLGLPIYGDESGNPFLGRDYGLGSRDYSEEAARLIDEEVKRILEEQYARALTVIEDNRVRVERLVEVLMEMETLDRDTFEDLMNDPLLSSKVIEAETETELEPSEVIPTD